MSAMPFPLQLACYLHVCVSSPLTVSVSPSLFPPVTSLVPLVSLSVLSSQLPCHGV